MRPAGIVCDEAAQLEKVVAYTAESKNFEASVERVNVEVATTPPGATMHMAAVRADRVPEAVRSFGTFTADLHRLADWFTQCGVETVVMESTSVY